MKIRIVALTVAALLVAVVPAGASHTYVGTAEATALKLTITPPDGEPQGLTFGTTSSTVASGEVEGCKATVCASAAAAVEPFGETVTVEVTDSPQEKSTQAFALPPELEPILSAQLGTATAAGTPEPGPTGTATAQAGQLEINVVGTILDPLQEQLDGAIDQIVEGLAPILDPIQEGDPTDLTENVETLVTDLVPALVDNPLATVQIGESSAVTADSPEGEADLEGVTTATATAAGAIVRIAPVPSVAADGLFRIEVGAATATAQTNQVAASASSEGAIARLFVADLTTVEPNDYQEVPVETGQPEQCVGQSPLLICIIAGGGDKTVDGSEAGAVAAAVRIRAFADADDEENPLPGVTLALAEAIAGVNAAGPDETEEEPDTLPRTGGGMLLQGLALLGVGSAGAYAIRRRR